MAEVKTVGDMTRKEFDALPGREAINKTWSDEIEFDCMVVLPARVNMVTVILALVKTYVSRLIHPRRRPEFAEVSGMHDSGYRCMDFVAVRNDVAICRISGCSDVIHIEGIAGFGDDWLNRYEGCPSMVPPTSWSVDCLANSGLLRFFPSTGKMKCGSSLSSFEIYQIEQPEREREYRDPNGKDSDQTTRPGIGSSEIEAITGPDPFSGPRGN